MSDEEPLSEYAPTSTIEIDLTRTVIINLQTSKQKNARAARAIRSWHEIADRMADLMPSYYPQQWEPRISERFKIVRREFPTLEEEHGINGLKAHDAYQALYKVAEAFKSWRGNGQPSDKNPRGDFGKGNYAWFSHDSIDVVESENGSYGVKIGLEPYNPEWFGVNVGSYQREYLERVVDPDDDLSAGASQLRLRRDGSLNLHMTCSETVNAYDPKGGDITTTVGVSEGEKVVAGLAVRTDGQVKNVTLENGSAASGAEFRHTRERLSEKRDRAFENGNLQKVKKARGYRERYTEQVLHTASRRVVDVARDHTPCAIAIRDLTNYRQTAENPIHDWPYASFQEKVVYKANEMGIPVVVVESPYSTLECRKCGCTDSSNRQVGDPIFRCEKCGYEIHAHLNAAINVAQRGATEIE